MYSHYKLSCSFYMACGDVINKKLLLDYFYSMMYRDKWFKRRDTQFLWLKNSLHQSWWTPDTHLLPHFVPPFPLPLPHFLFPWLYTSDVSTNSTSSTSDASTTASNAHLSTRHDQLCPGNKSCCHECYSHPHSFVSTHHGLIRDFLLNRITLIVCLLINNQNGLESESKN